MGNTKSQNNQEEQIALFKSFITSSNSDLSDNKFFKKYLSSFSRSGKSVPDKLRDYEREKKEIENEDLRQNIALKRNTLDRLFLFLAVETGLVFAITFYQGFKNLGFSLDSWNFRTLITATILQITTMLLVVVKHLFPVK